jgi:hypothetical protein
LIGLGARAADQTTGGKVTADKFKRVGLLLPKGRQPTVALVGRTEVIARSYPLLNAALAARPGYRLVIAVPVEHLAGTRRRYPHETVLPLPHPFAAGHWRRRLNIVMIVGKNQVLGAAEAWNFANKEESVAEEVARNLPPLDKQPKIKSGGTFLIDLLGGRRVASLTDLRARLRGPKTIICLGNGPSSENPKLADYAEATLFRVNWIWRQRGWMTEPDLVFTVDPDPPGRGKRPIIAFPTGTIGRPVLMRHALRLQPPKAGYMFLDMLEPPLADFAAATVPTNGALMIAVAATLQPERIIVAGIDLYRHPQGRYPGDKAALDGYSREHSADMDLGLIRNAFSGFSGEVIILSENLRKALDAG